MTPQELFDARDRGEKIEVRWYYGSDWATWSGHDWHTNAEFRIVKPEPKLVPHWPALRVYDGRPGRFGLTDEVYPTESAAKIVWSASFIRLATEYPPIMLEVKE